MDMCLWAMLALTIVQNYKRDAVMSVTMINSISMGIYIDACQQTVMEGKFGLYRD